MAFRVSRRADSAHEIENKWRAGPTGYREDLMPARDGSRWTNSPKTIGQASAKGSHRFLVEITQRSRFDARNPRFGATTHEKRRLECAFCK